jgi:hypothetical protein
MTSLWPAELTKPRLIATGFWFPSDPPRRSPAQKPLLVALLQDEIPTHLGAKEQLIRPVEALGSRTNRLDGRSATGSPLEDPAITRLKQHKRPNQCGGRCTGTTARTSESMHGLPIGQFPLEPGGDDVGSNTRHGGGLRHTSRAAHHQFFRLWSHASSPRLGGTAQPAGSFPW